jgi:cysteine desulfurase/selenocysteine lyase
MAIEEMDRDEAYDVERYRADFPILSTQVNGRPLVYLDRIGKSAETASGY